jgi:hypothetical protein
MIYRMWLPLSSRGEFPPVDPAPVLSGVKQTALDVGCASALCGALAFPALAALWAH